MKIKTHDLISVEGDKFLELIQTADTDQWGRCPVSFSLSFGPNVQYSVKANTSNIPCLGQIRPDRSKNLSAPEITPVTLKIYRPLDQTNPTAVITKRRNNNRFESSDVDREHPLWRQYEECSNSFKVLLTTPLTNHHLLT